MNVYHIERLTKIYANQDVPANDEITFRIDMGEIFGFLGDNGAGKSTLVRQMANLTKPTSGSIHLLGEPLDYSHLYVPTYIGYMPQNWLAINQLTVDEAIFHTAYLRGLSSRDARRERDRLVTLWDLGHLRHKTGRELSGGERRLLQVGIAMAASPPILILDEPTNELSPQRRNQVWDVLRTLNQSEGTTIIFITHDAIEAEKIIQRVGILVRGRLVALGKPSDLKKNIDQSLRLEIMNLDSEMTLENLHFPPSFAINKIGEHRWVLSLEREQVQETLTMLIDHGIEEFRLSSATLEDLYLHYAVATEPYRPKAERSKRHIETEH